MKSEATMKGVRITIDPEKDDLAKHCQIYIDNIPIGAAITEITLLITPETMSNEKIRAAINKHVLDKL